MDERAALRFRLLVLRLYEVGVRPGVLPDTRHQPGDLETRAAAADAEAVALDLLRHEHRRVPAETGELIAEVAVENAEPGRELHHRLALAVEHGDPVINVFPVGRLDERMVQVFVRRVEGMIDQEAASGLEQDSADKDVTAKVAGRDDGCQINVAKRSQKVAGLYADHALTEDARSFRAFPTDARRARLR